MAGIIGSIADAFYGAPTPNPAYGATQVSPDDYVKHLKAAGVTLPDNYTPPSDHLWLSPEGKDVTYAVNNLGLDPNQKFSDQPGFASRLFSPMARSVIEQNATSETYPGAQSQALQAQLTASKGQAEQDVQNTIGRVNSYSQYPNQRAMAMFGVGNPANASMYDTTTANQAAGVPRALAEEEAAVANAGTAAHPAEANPYIAQGAEDLAMHVTPAELARRQFEAQTIGVGGPTRQALMIGGQAGSPTISKIQNPLLGGQLGMYSSMMGGMGGAGGPSPVTSPTGNMYPPPAAASNITVPPLSYDLVGQPSKSSYDADEKTGQLIKDGIPIDGNDIKSHGAGGSWMDDNQAHKPLTTGQRLLQGIRAPIAGTPHPYGRAAQLNAFQAMNNRQADSNRIQQLTSILTNPPKHNAGKAGIVSDYTHDQLQDMADELDKLLGE